MTTSTREPSLDSPHIRFNWGYHDARWDNDHEDDRRALGHPRPLPSGRTEADAAYRAGYHAGHETPDLESSEPAWREHLRAKVAP